MRKLVKCVIQRRFLLNSCKNDFEMIRKCAEGSENDLF